MRADHMAPPDDNFGRHKRPKMHPRNVKRAELAGAAIKGFRNAIGRKNDNETDETMIGDMIANLFHLCKRDGIDMENLIERGRRNYQAELGRGDVDERNARRLEEQHNNPA